ncbi:MAG: ComEA family DNA-binding protein [Mycoplasmatota bacterium]
MDDLFLSDDFISKKRDYKNIFNKNKKAILIVLVILIVVFLCFFIEIPEEEIIEEVIIEQTEVIEEKIIVDIKGAVVSPGVYEITLGDRLIDLINLSGGLLDNANTDNINLSKILIDQDVIVICTNEDLIEIVYEPVIECTCDDDKVSINYASLEELMTLSSIGETTAQAIIDYRMQTPFIELSDILNVSGIGDATYEKIKDYISL